MYETLLVLGNGVYYIYIFSVYNQKIIFVLYTVYNVFKFFYIIGNFIVFNLPKQPDPLILDIGIIIDSELGEFEIINIYDTIELL
jgi:hypothetical protein